MKTQELELLTKKDIAQRTRMCQRSVDYWIERGWLTPIKLGKNVRFLESDFEKFLELRRIK